MCGQCRAVDTSSDWYAAALSGSLRSRRLARLSLARAASAALAPWGVTVSLYPGALTLDVRTRTGGVAVVSGLTEMIPAAERLTGKRFDPLAEEQIAVRERGVLR